MTFVAGRSQQSRSVRRAFGRERKQIQVFRLRRTAHVLHQNLEVARGFQPFSAAEMQTIRDGCRFDASDGHMELFKTTKIYDGDLGREMHGFPSSAELPV